MHGILQNIEKYGKTLGFYLGSKPFVVLADYKIMTELLKREELAGRPPTIPLYEFRPGYNTAGAENVGRPPGVILSQGSHWREQRRFLLRNLRDFGFGKSEMEDAILDEVEKLSTEFQKNVGHPVCLDNTLNVSIVNALWAILVGEKLLLNDPKLLTVVDNVNTFMKEASGLNNHNPIQDKIILILLQQTIKHC